MKEKTMKEKIIDTMKKLNKVVLDERQAEAVRVVSDKGVEIDGRILVSIPLEMLRIDYSYQRPAQNHARYIANNC